LEEVRRVARVSFVVGIVMAVLGASKVHAVAHGYDYTSSPRFAWSFGFVALLVIAAYGAGFPDLRQTRRSAWVGAIQVTVIATALFSAAQLVAGEGLLPRFVVGSVALFTVPWLVFCARLASTGAIRAEGQNRVFAVVSASDLAQLEDDLRWAADSGSQLAGTMAPAAASTEVGGLPLVDAVRSSDGTVLVLCRHAQSDETIVAQAALLHESGVRIRTLSLFYEEWLGKLPISELERTSLMFDIGEVHRGRYGRAKRIMDVVIGAVGLVPLALAVPFVAIGNLFGNRGPLLYRQERVGKAGERFQILKFRTMRQGSTAGDWTQDHDPRITPFGRLLRTTHVDELPQVLNILRGDLAVVGPRPEQPRYVDELNRKLPFYDLRHLVRPGLTGWAQVKYGYAGDERDALQKLQYEFYYLRHQRLALDLRIVGRTVRSVLGGAGRGR
jgi:lipopolysaccharide/colanic/teichoic acid biosynthesis glycosyltransferase